ncbi:MAG TPA: hypothetical protein VML55_01940 [Planctomycetaceae bacterium]|nr:hypothetical protein [Planctomycetaceae bacterium]
MRTARKTQFVAIAAAMVATISPQISVACPFCSAPSLTMTEQVAQNDLVILVKWVDATRPPTRERPADEALGEVSLRAGVAPGNARELARTVFEIVDVLKGPAGDFKKGQQVTLPQYRAAKKGDLFLLLGLKGVTIDWNTPLEFTEAAWTYVTSAPPPDQPTTERLKYFLEYLEFPDQDVANDAYGEFANAPYEDITPLADELPRERLRKWVASNDTPVTRLGLYGLLLGLCGTEDDARLLERKITEPTEEFRLGIDGIMGGYLILTGQQGLDLIDSTKLASKHQVGPDGKPVLDKDGKPLGVPFSETYAAMQALRFMWQYGEDRISQDRLRQSMRTLLDRPELSDLVIADLARWKDWSVQEKLIGLYDQEGYDIPSIKRAIVRYLLACTKDRPESASDETPEHVAQAEKHLADLRAKDPKIVRDAERFYFPD